MNVSISMPQVVSTRQKEHLHGDAFLVFISTKSDFADIHQIYDDIHVCKKYYLWSTLPFRTWLQNYETLFQIRFELLTFLISSATFYSMVSMTLFKSLNIRML